MTNWEADNQQTLNSLLIGKSYNNSEIDQTKSFEASKVLQYLDVKENDTVLDIGSGLGHIAYNIAPYCKKLVCIDISKSFLSEAENKLKKYSNVEYKHINHGVFNTDKVDKAYALAVFIHFNIYDVAIYLQEVYKTLNDNGKFIFNFLDAQYLDCTDDTFVRHKLSYTLDRNKIFNLINYNSFLAIKNMSEKIGFTFEVLEQGKQPMILLTKTYKL